MEDFLDCMKSIDSLKLHFKFTNKLESHDELVGTESDCVVVGATENLHQRVTDYNSYLPFDIMDHTPENNHKPLTPKGMNQPLISSYSGLNSPE
jgi:hypothetical protein